MVKIKDLTPKFKKLKPAFRELDSLAGEQETGQQSSGSSIFSSIFHRGRGETVFSVVGIGIRASAIRDQKAKAGFGTIQEAIDWVNLEGGGMVYLPVGTYTISSDITLYSNITLIGEDKDNCIIDFNNTSSVIKAIGSRSGFLSDIHIKNLTLKNCTNSTYASIRLESVSDSSVRHCSFDSNWNSGASSGGDVYLYDCIRVTVADCDADSSGTFVNAQWNNSYSNSNINLRILRNFADGGEKYFVQLEGRYMIIQGNYVEDTADDAFRLDAASSTIVTNNYVQRYSTRAVYVGGGDLHIVHNLFRANPGIVTGDCIYIDGISYSMIKDNLIEVADSNTGIYLGSNTNFVLMTGNQIVGDFSGTGINISAASCNSNMVSNNFYRSLSTNLSDSGTGTQNTDNLSA